MMITEKGLPSRLTSGQSLAFLFSFGLLSACGEPPPPNDYGSGGAPGVGGNPGTGATGPGTGGASAMPVPQVACPVRDAIYVTQANNYDFTSTMTIERSVLKDATDLTFDWSQVTMDFFGKPVDPLNDIDLFLVSLWKLTPAQLEDNLSIDSLPLDSVIAPVSTYPDGTFTSANLLSFDILGEPLDTDELWQFFDTSHPNFNTPSDSHTFLVTAQTGVEAGKNARMLHMFTIDPAATQTHLSLTNDSTSLMYQVELETSEVFQVPLGTGDLTIDWSYMDFDEYGGTNSLGNPFLADQINEVVVAHFANSTLGQLEENFLRLEELATSWYSSTEALRGYSYDLSQLVTAEGAPFTGIDGTGIWMAALFCRQNCNNPAPWSITKLHPCSP